MSKNSETKTRVKLTKYWFRLIRCQTHLSLVAWLPAESSELGPTGESGLWDSAGPHQDRVKPNLQRLVGSNVSIMITSSMTTLIPLIMTIRSLNTVSNRWSAAFVSLTIFLFAWSHVSIRRACWLQIFMWVASDLPD